MCCKVSGAVCSDPSLSCGTGRLCQWGLQDAEAQGFVHWGRHPCFLFQSHLHGFMPQPYTLILFWGLCLSLFPSYILLYNRTQAVTQPWTLHPKFCRILPCLATAAPCPWGSGSSPAILRLGSFSRRSEMNVLWCFLVISASAGVSWAAREVKPVVLMSFLCRYEWVRKRELLFFFFDIWIRQSLVFLFPTPVFFKE